MLGAWCLVSCLGVFISWCWILDETVRGNTVISKHCGWCLWILMLGTFWLHLLSARSHGKSLNFLLFSSEHDVLIVIGNTFDFHYFRAHNKIRKTCSGTVKVLWIPRKIISLFFTLIVWAISENKYKIS